MTNRITSFLFVLFLIGCNTKSDKINKCKANFKKAASDLNDYYKDSSQSHLLDALSLVQDSRGCDETKKASVELKSSLLILLKRYKEGADFIDSLDNKDFTADYKKGMYSSYFKSMEYKIAGDTMQRNVVLRASVEEIQDYIDHKVGQKGKINVEAYYDLFLVKIRLFDFPQVSHELDSLKRKYPEEQDFFDALKGTFKEMPESLRE